MPQPQLVQVALGPTRPPVARRPESAPSPWSSPASRTSAPGARTNASWSERVLRSARS